MIYAGFRVTPGPGQGLALMPLVARVNELVSKHGSHPPFPILRAADANFANPAFQAGGCGFDSHRPRASRRGIATSFFVTFPVGSIVRRGRAAVNGALDNL